jgi:hypothetical protein
VATSGALGDPELRIPITGIAFRCARGACGAIIALASNSISSRRFTQ